jgi:hypothetical protein
MSSDQRYIFTLDLGKKVLGSKGYSSEWPVTTRRSHCDTLQLSGCCLCSDSRHLFGDRNPSSFEQPKHIKIGLYQSINQERTDGACWLGLSLDIRAGQ